MKLRAHAYSSHASRVHGYVQTATVTKCAVAHGCMHLQSFKQRRNLGSNKNCTPMQTLLANPTTERRVSPGHQVCVSKCTFPIALGKTQELSALCFCVHFFLCRRNLLGLSQHLRVQLSAGELYAMVTRHGNTARPPPSTKERFRFPAGQGRKNGKPNMDCKT